MIFAPKPYLVHNIHLGRSLADKRIRGAEGGRRLTRNSPGEEDAREEELAASRARRERVKRLDVRQVIGRGVEASRAVCPIAALLYSKEAERRPGLLMQRGALGDRSRFIRPARNKKAGDGSSTAARL